MSAKFCPNCGNPTQPTDVFCRNCGHQLSDEVTAAPTEPLAHDVAPTERMETPVPTTPVAATGPAQPPPPGPSPSRWPPWLPIAIVGAVVVVGGVVALLLLGGDDEPAPTAVEFPAATTAPPADQGPGSRVLGQWTCETESSRWDATVQQGTWSFTDEDGVQVTGTWSYDQATNTFTFSGSAPDYGFDSLRGTVTVTGGQLAANIQVGPTPTAAADYEFVGSLQDLADPDSDPDPVQGSVGPGDTGSFSEPSSELTCRRA
jgi:hypothetical protein